VEILPKIELYILKSILEGDPPMVRQGLEPGVPKDVFVAAVALFMDEIYLALS
jgi:hypothetical protein